MSLIKLAGWPSTLLSAGSKLMQNSVVRNAAIGSAAGAAAGTVAAQPGQRLSGALKGGAVGGVLGGGGTYLKGLVQGANEFMKFNKPLAAARGSVPPSYFQGLKQGASVMNQGIGDAFESAKKVF